jgi:hypothetical protein
MMLVKLAAAILVLRAIPAFGQTASDFESEYGKPTPSYSVSEQWSPEQVAGYLRRQGLLSISHETIYRHVWRDERARRGALHPPARRQGEET